MVKRRKDWGKGWKKDDHGGFVFWITVSMERKFPIGQQLVNLSTPKNLSLKGVTVAPTIVAHGKQTWLENCTPASKIEAEVCLVEIISAKGQWQILNQSIILPGFFTFLLSSSLTFRTPLFSESRDSLRYYHCKMSPIGRELMFLCS